MESDILEHILANARVAGVGKVGEDDEHSARYQAVRGVDSAPDIVASSPAVLSQPESSQEACCRLNNDPQRCADPDPWNSVINATLEGKETFTDVTVRDLGGRDDAGLSGGVPNAHINALLLG